MLAIHAFDSLKVSPGTPVVYQETRNASNCIKKPKRAVRRQTGMSGASMELERRGQELAIYLSLRERSRPSARVRAHASS